ncbi:MAG: SDR family NAD(P)-dependent oxidoreductase, partial [Candidatus Marinimicrobia bacterium]|nr:SDR family NAD(P)-dependent oxidoreductase [Candidatus Neomarinimicrobiota bacterium]
MKTALVTGASSGIGKVMANSLLINEYKVFGTSRNPEHHQEDLDFELLELDVTDDESVRTCVNTFIERNKSIDILINNAGFAQVGSVEETDIAQAREQLETNFWGYVKVTQAVLPHMRSQRSGYILNISSLAGSLGVPLQGYYSASKHAVDGFTKSLRMEVRKFGIKVVL